MGLAAREMEARRLSTLVLSVMPEITASMSPPRLAGIGFPGAIPFGPPGDAECQRSVLRAALDAFERLAGPGERIDLDFPGPPRSQRYPPEKPPPIASLLRQRPWLVPRLLSGKIP